MGNATSVSWLQYALRTVDAEAWSSEAVDPQVALIMPDMRDETSSYCVLQTHDCKSVTASGQTLLRVWSAMLTAMAFDAHPA